jgi:hypothetical protein
MRLDLRLLEFPDVVVGRTGLRIYEDDSQNGQR